MKADKSKAKAKIKAKQKRSPQRHRDTEKNGKAGISEKRSAIGEKGIRSSEFGIREKRKAKI